MKWIPLVVVLLAFSACGSSKVQNVNSNPQVQKEEKAAQKIVQGCVEKGNFLTHSGRQAVITCIAPPNKKVQFEKCAQKAIASGGFLTKHQRKNTEIAISNCLVTTR